MFKVALLALLFSTNLNATIPTVRVKVAKNLPQIHISGTDLSRELTTKKSVKSFPGRKTIRFNCEKFKKSNRRFNYLKRRPIQLASLSSKTGLLSLEENKYDGRLILLSSPAKDACDVVQETNLETYLSSLLSKEMNAVWPIEALKAQAVAARTYALNKIKKNKISPYYDMENSEKHQVGGHFFDATAKTVKAARKTMGEVLLGPDGNLKPLFFHASCGGRTLRPDQVWENVVKGYSMVECKQCQKRTNKRWSKTISLMRFEKFVDWLYRKKHIKRSIKIKNLSELKFVKHRQGHVNFRFYVNDRLVVLPKSLLRRYFGRFHFPSNFFSMAHDLKRNRLVVRGNGLGHGVGMCQLGALDMAKQGKSYKQILAHYFPHHKLVKKY